MTRYALLYTSLSTDYTIDLASESAVALPFTTAAGPIGRPTRAAATLRQEQGTGAAEVAPIQLRGVAVSSNATGMIHAEEMQSLAGPLKLTRTAGARSYQVHNGTGLRLRQAMIVEHNQHRAILGTIEPGASTEFVLLEGESGANEMAVNIESVPTTPETSFKTIELADMMNLACRTTSAEELCLVAWTGDDLPGLNVKPTATQSRRAALVVAHLSYGPPPPIQIDFNSRAQVSAGAEDDVDVLNGVSALFGAPLGDAPNATLRDPHTAGQP